MSYLDARKGGICTFSIPRNPLLGCQPPNTAAADNLKIGCSKNAAGKHLSLVELKVRYFSLSRDTTCMHTWLSCGFLYGDSALAIL
jgi:hypothetical protein